MADWPEVRARDEGQNASGAWARSNLLACPECGAVVAREHKGAHIEWHYPTAKVPRPSLPAHPWRRHATSKDPQEPCAECGIYREVHDATYEGVG